MGWFGRAVGKRALITDAGSPRERELVKERKSSERRGEIVLSEGIQRCR